MKKPPSNWEHKSARRGEADADRYIQRVKRAYIEVIDDREHDDPRLRIVSDGSVVFTLSLREGQVTELIQQ